MTHEVRATFVALALLLCAPPAQAHQSAAEYGRWRSELKKNHLELRRQLRSAPRRERVERLRPYLLGRVDAIHKRWLGSRWGLGMPQSTQPHLGKTNCGLFVAVVLRDAGFNLPIWKFNRQASYHAIRSVAPRRMIRYFRRAPMSRFLAEVKKLGPGLFLIGLDFHIGFLRQGKKGGLRFVHASYESHKVVDEAAATAGPIVSSRYRMVGKILQPQMLRWWLARKRIHVLGRR